MLLLIPGPVTTRPEVRAAMTVDIAPWDNDSAPSTSRFAIGCWRSPAAWRASTSSLPLQGCGHFITEAAMRTFIPPGGRLLIPATGAYTDRMVRLAREAGRVPVPLPIARRATRRAARRSPRRWQADPSITHVGMVYSETGSGVVHDPAAIGARGARGRAPDDRRCGLGVRRAAAGPVARSRRSMRSSSPRTSAWRRCPASPSRSPASTGWRRAPATPEAGRSTWPTSTPIRCAAARAASASRRRRRCSTR